MILLIYIFSKQAVFDNKKAIRGGIPLVFRKSMLLIINVTITVT